MIFSKTFSHQPIIQKLQLSDKTAKRIAKLVNDEKNYEANNPSQHTGKLIKEKTSNIERK